MLRNSVNILIIGNGGIMKSEGKHAYANRDVGDFIENLQRINCNVLYLSQGSRTSVRSFLYSYNLEDHGIRYCILKGGKRNPRYYLGILRMACLILKFRYTYIFYPGGLSSIAARICIFFRKKYGVYVRGYGLYKPGKSEGVDTGNKFNDIYALSHARYLITVSPKMQRDLQEYNSNVTLIKPMMKWDLGNSFIRNRNSFKQETWKFLFVGSVDERKGIYELFEIAGIMEQKGIEFSIDLVGDGPLLEYIIRKQKKKNYSGRVNILGSISDDALLSEIFEKSHAFLLLSRNEGFPRVLYEAMIKGLPVFTTLVSGIEGTMVSGYNCIELPVGDPEGQSEVILSTISNHKLLCKISENGLKTIEGIFQERTPHHHVLINNLNQLIPER